MIKNSILILVITLCFPAIAEDSITAKMWQDNYKTYQKIFHMPFNQEMINSTLDESQFKEYIIQDYMYLIDYKKAYEIALLRATNDEAMSYLYQTLEEIEDEIRLVHQNYFKKLNIKKSDLIDAVQSPNALLYTSFLIRTAATEPTEVSLSAFLPCHWVYYQIGKDMRKTATKKQNQKYSTWINAYGTKEWEDSGTKKLADLIDKMSKNSSQEVKSKMLHAYRMSTNMEYMFWDGAYNKIKWIDR